MAIAMILTFILCNLMAGINQIIEAFFEDYVSFFRLRLPIGNLLVCVNRWVISSFKKADLHFHLIQSTYPYINSPCVFYSHSISVQSFLNGSLTVTQQTLWTLPGRLAAVELVVKCLESIDQIRPIENWDVHQRAAAFLIRQWIVQSGNELTETT